MRNIKLSSLLFVKLRKFQAVTTVQYEELVAQQPNNYDNWFDYLKLEEAVSTADRVRSLYERAVENLPPSNQKLHWQRYIYLWINYAIYEELIAQDVLRAREVYRACLKVIPHSEFTFAKIWILAAQLEVRYQVLCFVIDQTPSAPFLCWHMWSTCGMSG